MDRMRHPLMLPLALLALGCQRGGTKQTVATADSTARVASSPPAADSDGRIQMVLGATVSTEDSGLFDVLLPAFAHAHHELALRVIPIGTGQAIEPGRTSDADVLLVHAPASESEFVAKGYGVKRCAVMYSDFVIVGPKADPAAINGLKDATDALRRIARAGATFVSRGDDSGTHRKEQSLWEEAHIVPAGPWYLQAGHGMTEVLTMASEKLAYTLTDMGTYLSVRDHNALEVLVQGDRRLINQYGVIPVAGARNAKGAETFAEWITSADGQHIIADYGVAKFGQPLFIPNANGC